MAFATTGRDVRIDTPVYTSDGKHIGYVKEVRRDAFKLDAPWRPDYWLGCEEILSANAEEVRLAVASDNLDVARREEPGGSDERVPERYRTRAYDETWRGPGPDYLEPGREWERVPERPDFSYGEWERNQPLPSSRGYEREWREPREPFYRDSNPRGYRPQRGGMERSPQDDDRWGTRQWEYGGGYPDRGRYRGPAGVEGAQPRYSQERGWGYQGQGGWNARLGAVGTYSEPFPTAYPRYSGESGQPGRGYDREIWGESQWYDSEAPRGHAGRGPRNYNRPDSSILDEVCERLTYAGRVDATDIEVKVKDGEVTLKGQVDDRTQKRLAESIADQVPGVRDVHNELRAIGRPASKDDTMYLV
jgi:hypothetical protein